MLMMDCKVFNWNMLYGIFPLWVVLSVAEAIKKMSALKIYRKHYDQKTRNWNDELRGLDYLDPPHCEETTQGQCCRYVIYMVGCWDCTVCAQE